MTDLNSGRCGSGNRGLSPASLILGDRPADPRRARIGIFDSGVGGLTVLRELYRHLPNESLLYLADTARLPYGTRSPQEILTFAREILTWMAMQQVKMVVMACNTSSALALDIVRNEFDFPVLGLILPAAKAAVQVGQRIGVIATPGTASSNAYRRAITEVDATVRVWQVGCPEFVPIVEQNRLTDPATVEVAQTYLNPLLNQNIDTLIYGCTHYPHLAPVILPLLPPGVQIVDPAVHMATAAAQELELLGLNNISPPRPTRFCTTGDPQEFAALSAQWLGCDPLVEQVALPDLDRMPVQMRAS